MIIGRKTILAFFGFLIIFGVTHAGGFTGSVKHFKEVTGGQKLLDLEPEFNSAGVYRRLETIGAEGRQAYLQVLIISDTIFPLSAFVFLFLLGKYASSKIRYGAYVKYYWLPPLVFLSADFVENASVAILILNYPDEVGGVAAALGFITVLKKASMTLSFAMPPLVMLYAKLSNR
ncbi:MAG: hypothetical protein JXQ97_11575 [Natronospirillum sp.]